MPNGQKKTGKSAHSNQQRAKEREEMNTKIKNITKEYEDQMGFLETRSKELTQEIANTKKNMIKKNEEVEEKLSKSRKDVENLQNELIKQINENDELNDWKEGATKKTKEQKEVIINLNKQAGNMMKEVQKIRDFKKMLKEGKGRLEHLYLYNIIEETLKIDKNGNDIKEEKKMCTLCENELDCPYGHNGEPLCNGRVCDNCNKEKVIQFRMINAVREGTIATDSTGDMTMKKTEITKEEFEKAMKDPNVVKIM
jgi:hypothetical protein